MENSTLKMPAVALRGMTILPGMITHFDVSRSRSVKAVERAVAEGQPLFVVTQRDPEMETPEQDDVFAVGIISEVKQIVKMPHNIMRVLVEGVDRAGLLELSGEEYLEAEVSILPDEIADDLPEEAMFRNLKEIFERYCQSTGKIGKDLAKQVSASTTLEKLMEQVSIHTPLGWEQQQELLENMNFADRYDALCIILNNEMEIEAFRRKIHEKVKARVDKQQKEYILREQMKVIREELGDDGPNAEAAQFREAADRLEASDEVKERLEKEIQRFLNSGFNSAEASVIRGYIETLLELPWDKRSEDCLDLKKAEEVLEAEHYGLKKVKERVLEFLAVRKMLNAKETPILCLVGPPGTGKTSIARSIAHALDKKYVRICLGGVHDEAEIRGHRRTYIGAMPGRIVDGIRQAGVKNPLMVLDEIDKVSSDHRGDTFSALLEVLDSEQNGKFRDHYVELPVDLSEVLFIASANSLSDIPGPLRDRMEIIEVSSYTENEKLHIAKDHLIAKQLKKNGVNEKQLKISDKALREVIAFYTREAGVRGLERRLGEICRKAARRIYEGETEKIRVSGNNLEEFLGKPKYREDKKNKKDEIGIVRGLAWTSVGGVTLEIEVNVLPGKGELVLTGKLGDVMKESARAGISYIRSISSDYGIDPEFFTKHDIHVHIPEGAVPKDGPSAGITMALAILSAITERPVRADIAMTGEITIRGRVLPIGGLKEKLLAAKNAGMKTVCIPKDNERDLSELSEEITEGMEILPIDHMNQLIKAAFV